MDEFRKMRRFKQEISKEECDEILKTEMRGVLAVSGENGYPYTVPLNFVYKDEKVYFHSASDGHKTGALEKDCKVSFCVMKNINKDEQGFWFVRSVVIFGRIQKIEDMDVKTAVLTEIGHKYNLTEEMIQDELKRNGKRVCVMELTVDHMTGKQTHEK